MAYCRVSHSEQVQNGLSLEIQAKRLQACAMATGHEIGEIFVDAGISAGSMRRPELKRLLDSVRSGRIEALYVTKLDRLSRNLGDLLEIVRLFEKHAVALISASESIDSDGAAGKMMLQLLGVFAEFERSRTSERIRDVLGERRRQRKAYSRCVPFGYRRIRDELVINVKQQKALVEARKMRGNGASLREIALRLTNLGVRTNNGGKQWYAETIRQILNSRMGTEEQSRGL